MKRFIIILILLIIIAVTGIIYLSWANIPVEKSIVQKNVSIVSPTESVQ